MTADDTAFVEALAGDYVVERELGRGGMGSRTRDAGAEQHRVEGLAGVRWPASAITDVTRLARDVVELRTQAGVC